jgi:hypothetical protein
MTEVTYEQLQPGQRVRITHRVRVGKREWPATVEGTIRDLKVLVTGLTVERGEDDVFAVPTVHLVKDNGELSSITVDEFTRFDLLDSGSPPAANAPAT